MTRTIFGRTSTTHAPFWLFSPARVLASGMLLLVVAAPALADAPFGSEQIVRGSFDRPGNVAAGDLDGINGADVFYSSEGTQVLEAALRQAGGTWSPQLLLPNARSRSVELADLDGDGDLDLYYGDFNNSRVFWRENDLDVSGFIFPPAAVGGSIGRVQGVTAADIDGDMDLDVVAAGRNSDSYEWIENVNGDGSSWTNHVIASSVNAAQVVVAADLDGDGDLDVAGGSASGSGKLAWYENANGDGSTWVSRDIYSATINAVAAGDLDLDGDLDLVVQDRANSIRWWENTAGDGTAWSDTVITMLPGNATKGLELVDLDFDGDLDVVGDQRGDWWENISKAASWTARSYSGGIDLLDVSVVDVDEDGDRDIVAVRNSADQVSWWANLTCSPGDADDDGDGVRNGCDVCTGFDDTQDSDGDLTPDGCDVCPGEDDRVDLDGNGTPDACEGAGGSIAIDNVTRNEGDSGTTAFTFTVTLSGAVAGGFSVDYFTQDGAATTADGDYASTTGTLNFAGTDGEQQTLTVQVNGDLKVESPEGFEVVLGAPSDASVTVDDDTGNGTIANDDTASVSIADTSVAEGDSGINSLTFTATLSGEVDGGFAVEFYTQDNTASAADADYVPISTPIFFTGTDGEQRTATVSVVGDTKVEADEIVFGQIRNPTLVSVTIPAGRGRGTLVNDDSAIVSVDSVAELEGDSGNTAFQFTATLDREVVGGVNVPWSTADGTATTADGDYTSASGTLTFTGSAGETQTLTVQGTGDTKVEVDETFLIDLGTPSHPDVVSSDGTGTLTNDDSATIAIDDVTASEGDAGATTFSFTVTLTGEVAGGFTVPWSTADNTAAAGTDYTAASGTLTFTGTDGETLGVSVDVQGDLVVETDETFFVNLGSPSNASVTPSDGTGVGTITNDDSATIAINDVTASEGDTGTTTFSFAVTLSGEVAGGFTVPWSTTDNTAAAGSDYTAASGTLTFTGTDGETQTVSVDVQGDATVESDEAFFVNLGSPSNSNVTPSDGTGAGTITNDDTATVAIDDVRQTEGDAGTTTFAFTVTLSGEVDGGFTVPWSTADSTATAGTDYTAASGTLTFTGTDGETQAVSIDVQGDLVVENDETFFVNLGTPSNSNVTPSDGTGVGTIINDDSATISIDDVGQVEGDAGTTAFSFTVTLSGEVDGGFTVPWSTADNTAAAGSDYTTASGTLTFTGTDGETQAVSVDVLGDLVVEDDETFFVNLGSPSNGDVTVAGGPGVGTVLNDDSATITIDDVDESEGDAGSTVFTFTVTLSGEVDGGFTVTYATIDGTATTTDSDYLAGSGSLAFTGTDGETQIVSISVQGDVVVEGDETFFVSLGPPSNGDVTVDGGPGVGTIVNDDSAVLSIGDVSLTEGDTGTTTATFTVTLSGEVAGGFTVGVSTADGTADASSDYGAATAVLTFDGTDGETETFDVDVTGDMVVEADKTFFVNLGSPSNANVTLGDGTATGTIANDDSATIAIDDVGQAEGDAGTTILSFTVTLSGEVAGGFTVDASTADGSAVAGSDYGAATATLSFDGTDGETETFDVEIFGDAVVEADEAFLVNLGTPSNTSVTATDDTATGTIANDDSASVAIDDVAQVETDSGTLFTFTVTLSGDVAGGFTVAYATADGTATTADDDYLATSGTLTFTGGDGEAQTLDVTVQGDLEVESDETFSVLLDPPSNASVGLGDGTGVGTIENDDSGPLLYATKEVESYVSPFDTVVYRIVITNLGDGDQVDDPASNEFEDLLPSELELVDASSDAPTFVVTVDPDANAVYGNGTLAPGEMVTILIEAAVLADADTAIANQGTIRFDADRNGVNESTDVTDDPAVAGDGDATVLLTVLYLEVPVLGGAGLALLALLLALAAVRRTS